jgi:phosphoribosyl-AMP cyclohydrolase
MEDIGKNKKMNQQLLDRLASSDQLLPAIVQDAASKEVLMLAWVNRHSGAEAVTKSGSRETRLETIKR